MPAMREGGGVPVAPPTGVRRRVGRCRCRRRVPRTVAGTVAAAAASAAAVLVTAASWGGRVDATTPEGSGGAAARLAAAATAKARDGWAAVGGGGGGASAAAGVAGARAAADLVAGAPSTRTAGAGADSRITYPTYGQLLGRMRSLAAAYPDTVTLVSAQEAYGLPTVGTCDEATGGAGAAAVPAPCRVWVMEVGRRRGAPSLQLPPPPSGAALAGAAAGGGNGAAAAVAGAAAIAADAARPAVLISGAIHGDEAVGPGAAVAFAELLAAAVGGGGAAPTNGTVLPPPPMDPVLRAWLVRLADTRAVTVVPMGNALGYSTGVRGEDQSSLGGPPAAPLDPNRDFPFGVAPAACMRTVTARAFNELFRARPYTLLLTFHGGINALGYPWGDWGHCPRPGADDPPRRVGGGAPCEPAPDGAAAAVLSDRLAAAAGTGGGVAAAYPSGPMGPLVYPVAGGMEDWAYGAGWSTPINGEPGAVVCEPTTLGGYAAERTTLRNSSHRCVTYLVETADEKRPDEATLGRRSALGHLHGGGDGDGHVPRNVRLMVAAVDGAGVYVDVVAIGGAPVHPAASLWPAAAGGDPAAACTSGVDVEFFVGGALTVDAATLHVSTRAGEADPAAPVIGPVAGTGGTPAAPGTRFRLPLPPLPTAVREKPPPPPLYVRVAVKVDGLLARNGPQSHLVNARVNDRYRVEVGDAVVQGRSVWYSRTLRVAAARPWGDGGVPRGAQSLHVVDVTDTPEGAWDGRALTPPPGTEAAAATADYRSGGA